MAVTCEIKATRQFAYRRLQTIPGMTKEQFRDLQAGKETFVGIEVAKKLVDDGYAKYKDHPKPEKKEVKGGDNNIHG